MTDRVGVARMLQLGATYRQITHWSNVGLLSAGRPGTGCRRTFTDRDVAVAVILTELDVRYGSGTQRGTLRWAADPLLAALDAAGWPPVGWLVVGPHGWEHVGDDGLGGACRRHQPARTVNLQRLAERAAP